MLKTAPRASRSRSTTIDGFTIYTCDLGWRTISFLKISTKSGLAGWAEFTEDFGNRGLVAVVESLRESVLGRDAGPVALLTAEFIADRTPVPGGMNRQAIAVVENALLDLKARSLDLSVAELIGGPFRTRIPVYWSHCGTYRQGQRAQQIGVEPIESYDELRAFAAGLPETGIRTVKTNMLAFDDRDLQNRVLPWTRRPSAGGRLWDDRCIDALRRTLGAFRDGFGDEIGLIVDLNSGYRSQGLRRIERALREFDLEWIEVDGIGPQALADVRRHADTAFASGESLFGRDAYAPYFSARSFDVGIVDVTWNGMSESLRVAADAELRSIEVAPHNFYGHLSTFMSAQFCAAIPNFDILEVDIDGVPWRDDLVSTPPVIEEGSLVLPDGPGWGVDVNEAAVAARAVSVSE